MSGWTDVAPADQFGPGQSRLINIEGVGINIEGVGIAVFNLACNLLPGPC